MNAIDEIRADLLSLRDEEYRQFQSKLMPEVPPNSVIGVRMPALRAFSKRLFGTEQAEEFLKAVPHYYYEENNLHMALIEQISDPDLALAALESFLPYLDNWATCDSFFPKALLKTPELLLLRIRLWLKSSHPFTVRYGLVRLLSFLDEPHFKENILELAASVEREEYYIRMAQAWFFSIALIKCPDCALPYLWKHRLSPWVHNKAIQKAKQSLRCTPEYRHQLTQLRISVERKESSHENDNSLLS